MTDGSPLDLDAIEQDAAGWLVAKPHIALPHHTLALCQEVRRLREAVKVLADDAKRMECRLPTTDGSVA